MRRALAALLVVVPLLVVGPPARAADLPSAATCQALRPARWAAPTGTADARGDLRVIGIQYRQDISAIVSYDSFRTRIQCLFSDFVVPLEVPGRPTLVVLNEDIGLMTLAVGARGATVRAQAGTPLAAPIGDAEPVGVLGALGELNTAYSPQIAADTALLGPSDPRKAVLLAETDTLVRAFSRTFSDVAKQYGVYVVACNTMADYRETHDATEVAEFGDPALEPGLTTAYVPTSTSVTNSTFLWGPADVHPDAPDGERNLLFENRKVPLTSLETQILGLDAGPSTGVAGRANAAGWVVAGHRLGFATSLPAFVYGYDLGAARPAGDPCADTSLSYVPCMDSLGVDTLIQAEANPGRWTGSGSADPWQPLEWMSSSWRAVSDPTVHFRYAVNPMLVGNLLDLPFDGQSAILERGAGGRGHYIGDGAPAAEDIAADAPYAGDLPGFLALAPWVTPDGSRTDLRAEGAKLAPGSGDAQENDYLETAVYADLTPAGTPVTVPSAAPTAVVRPTARATARPTPRPTTTRRGTTVPTVEPVAVRPVAPTKTLAFTGAASWPPLVALMLITAALARRRTRRRAAP